MRQCALGVVLLLGVACDKAEDPTFDDCRAADQMCRLAKAFDNPATEPNDDRNMGVCLGLWDSYHCRQGCGLQISCSPGETCVPLEGGYSSGGDGVCVPTYYLWACTRAVWNSAAVAEAASYSCEHG